MRKKKRNPISVLQWRQDKGRVRAAQKLFEENPVFQEMFAIAEGATPLNGNQLEFSNRITEHDRSRHLGRIEGYNMAIKVFELLAVYLEKPKQLTTSYIEVE